MRGSSRYTKGFSIVELLVVMAIIALLSSAAAPALTSMAMGGSFNQSLIAASGAFERARAYAVANDTYTYVGFSAPDTNGQILVGVLGSRDGSSGGVSTGSGGTYQVADPGNPGTNSLVLLDRFGKIQGSQFTTGIPSGNALTTNSSVASASSPAASDIQFTCKSRVYGTVTLGNVVEFTPGGQARVAAAVPASVQLVLVPARGNPANPVNDNAEASAIRIAGLTGQVMVYRP